MISESPSRLPLAANLWASLFLPLLTALTLIALKVPAVLLMSLTTEKHADLFWLLSHNSSAILEQSVSMIRDPQYIAYVQFRLPALGDNVENVTDELAMIRSFLKQKFPTEDLRNEFVTAGSDEVGRNEKVVGSDLPNESHNEAEEYAPLSAMQVM
ncbi:hypothetical protein ACQJBY_001370 [Aegilops geniculata]